VATTLNFQLFIVSVDFDTTRRVAPYYALKKLLPTMGGVLAPTHQIRLLLTPLSAKTIRDTIKRKLLRNGDRVYVGKIAAGSAWHGLLRISNAKLKTVLRVWAKGAEPAKADLAAARKALKSLLP
jgi:hypothetical protein